MEGGVKKKYAKRGSYTVTNKQLQVPVDSF